MASSAVHTVSILAAFAALIAGWGPAQRRYAAHVARRDARRQQTLRRPLQVVAADLRRLARQLALVPAGASMVRRQALQAAYDDVLLEAAAMLEVPSRLPEIPPGRAKDLERMRVQSALRGEGLAVPA